MPSDFFRKVVKQSVADGTSGKGRREYVLMSSSAPYGRNISDQTLRNYRIMIEEVENI